jgi:hypothetical protein
MTSSAVYNGVVTVVGVVIAIMLDTTHDAYGCFTILAIY